MSDDDNNDDNGRHKETFNFIIDDESLGASNLRDHLKKLEEQKVLFEKLSNFAFADFGTNEIERARRIQQIKKAGYDEPYAREMTTPPESITEGQLTLFLQERDKGAFWNDMKTREEVEAGLRKHFNLPKPGNDVLRDRLIYDP